MKDNKNDVIQYILAVIFFILMMVTGLVMLIITPDDRYYEDIYASVGYHCGKEVNV